MGLGADPGRYPAEVLDAYRRAFDDPGAVEAMCEDYRAGASVDAAFDEADREAGRTIACPVLVLWGGRGGLPRFYGDVLEVWRAVGPRRPRPGARRLALPARGSPAGDRRPRCSASSPARSGRNPGIGTAAIAAHGGSLRPGKQPG